MSLYMDIYMIKIVQKKWMENNCRHKKSEVPKNLQKKKK